MARLGRATISVRDKTGLGAAMPTFIGKIWRLRSPKPKAVAARSGASQRKTVAPPQIEGPRIFSAQVGVVAPIVADQSPPTLIERLTPDVERTIQALSTTTFDPDPLAGQHFSRIVSLLSSSYKRHGFILELAIRRQLATNPNFEVWADPQFLISPEAKNVALSMAMNSVGPVPKHVKYGKGENFLQVDAIVWDKQNETIRAYEVKRGHGAHDAGKRRTIRNDLFCVESLLIDYAKQRGYKAKSARAHAIFYYGKRSLPAPLSIIGSELDEHFNMSIYKEVEAVNEYFRRRLFEILSN